MKLKTTESTATMSFSYPYKPLDTSVDSIRLLKLNSDSDSDQMSCELIHTTFASKPKYEALSYTWGPPDPVKTVTIDGHVVKVRENLYWALLNWRRGMIELVFWVDAIYINQDDLEERNRQVSLMAFIYSRAQGVRVWLGRPVFPPPEMKRYKMEYEPEYEPELVYSLRDVDYWRRVWIVQEIGLARNIPFFYEFCNRTVHSEWESYMGTLEDRALRENQDAKTLLPLKLKKQREGRHGEMNQLEQLLETYVHTGCQEPRDKIYGFLGLAHDCQNGSLNVDYSKPLLDLYMEVIAFQ
jgi:hypothetical protein